jgi:hypothetical protein
MRSASIFFHHADAANSAVIERVTSGHVFGT